MINKMADPVRTTESLKNLRFSELEKQWVDEVWEQDFTEKPELPPSLAQDVVFSRSFIDHLQQGIKSCVPWARIDFATLPQGFWSVLSESELSPRSLLALLHCLMAGVDKVLSSAVQREAAVLAASLYFILNEIPGSGAYKIFHPLLFQEAVDLLKQWPDPATGKRSQATQGRRTNKARRVDDGTNEDDGMERMTPFDDGDDEDNDGEINVLTPNEISALKSAVLGALRNFVHLLRNSTYKDADQSTEHAVQILSELTRTTGDQSEIDIFDSTASPSTTMSVTRLSYLGLAALCSTSHGNVTDMFTMVLKHQMPSLLMLMGENEAVAMATIPKTIQIIKANTIAFIRRLATDLEDKAVPSLRVLLQHLCVKVPDKAEYRAKTAQTVTTILSFMPREDQDKFIEWLYKFSRNVKISHRVFALEVAAEVMELLPKDQEEQTPATTAAAPAPAEAAAAPAGRLQYLSVSFLINMLLSRCADRAPTVRAKALTCFAEFTTSPQPSVQQVLKELFCHSMSSTTPAPSPQLAHAATPQVGSVTSDKNHGNTANTNLVNEGNEEVQDGATPGNLLGGSPALLLEMSVGSSSETVGQNIIAMLQKRARDEKVGVRKAALQALENILHLKDDTITAKELQVLHTACQDPALSVRKQAVHSLSTLLLEKKSSVPLQKLWLQCILRGILDQEVSAQEKCLQALKEILLDGLSSRHGDSDASRLSWSLLRLLSQDDTGDARPYLPKACHLLSKQKMISDGVVRALVSHIDHEDDQAAWLLLAEVAPYSSTCDTRVIQRAWDRCKQADSPIQLVTCQHVLSVIGSLAGRLADDVRQQMISDLRKRLLNFDTSPELSRSLVSALNKLCLAVDGTSDKTSATMEAIAVEVLQACSAYLSKIVLEESPTQVAVCEATLIRYLGVLGEVACLCPAKTPRRVFMLVQSLLAGPTKFDGDSIPGSQMASQSQPPLSQFGLNTVLSDTVRAHVFITLGKLCLLHESLAKQCIAAFSRELKTSSSPAVRNNVAIIMCDLCIRYPNVVDRYMVNLSMCFKDESELVRKQSLTLLTRLLLEDYVKWKGTLFFHFVSTLVDDVKEIRDFAEFTLVQLLLKRHPNLLHQHFMESIFYFSAYDQHNVYNRFSQTDREKQLFTLKGAPNAEKRRTIFCFMLQHMTDEHRFKLTAKLCQEVLAAIVDGAMPLNEDTKALLEDTLYILCSKEIKLTSLRPRATSDIDDQMEMAEAVINQAKTKIITQVVKKNVIENIVPVVIALKHMLEKVHSPTLRHLMLYLKQLMKDYRNEVKDILAADRQLAAEIEFDLRRFEEEEAEAAKKQEALLVAMASLNTGSKRATPRTRPATPRTGPATPRPSPQNRPGLPTVLSPRAVANCSPRIIRTPRAGVVDTPKTTPPATPTSGIPGENEVPTTHGGVAATPTRANRPISLATQAIVNSARKAISSARRRPPLTSMTPKPQQPEVDKGRELNAVATKERSPLKEKNLPAQNKTPPRRGLRGRAVSTPDQTIANITFQAPMDLSVIPASPISCSPLDNVFSGTDPKKVVGTASWTPQVKIENNPDVLLMFSPDQPTSRPRQWNITSPKQGPQRGKAKTSAAPTGTTGESVTTGPQGDRRRTRASTSSMAQQDEETETRGSRSRRSSRSKRK